MKRLLTLSILLLLVLTVVGCGSDSTAGENNVPEANSNSETNDSSGEVENANENDTESQTSESDFPKKPITVIVPFSAGGGTDATARSLASATEEFLGQSIGVVNKTGGGGAIGMSEGADAEPDGYTVTFATIELATLHHLGLADITYEDFTPIAKINKDPAAVTVAADSPYETLQDFLDYAKDHPNELDVGTLGTGDIWDFAAWGIKKEAGVEFKHVPFDGAAPAVTALLGGHVDAVTVSPAEVLAQVQAGELRMLAVMDDQRSDALPDAPTFEEEGMEVEHPVSVWRGILVPKGTPDDVVEILTDAFMKGAESDEFVDYMSKNGLGIDIKNAEDFRKEMAESDEYFKDLVEEFDLKE